MKRMQSKTLLPALSTILLAGGALAEDNLTKLGQFKTTGVTEFTTIAQDAPAANSIRNILRAIELPPGFTIDLYALVPDARHMAMAPQGSCRRRIVNHLFFGIIARGLRFAAKIRTLHAPRLTQL